MMSKLASRTATCIRTSVHTFTRFVAGMISADNLRSSYSSPSSSSSSSSSPKHSGGGCCWRRTFQLAHTQGWAPIINVHAACVNSLPLHRRALQTPSSGRGAMVSYDCTDEASEVLAPAPCVEQRLRGAGSSRTSLQRPQAWYVLAQCYCQCLVLLHRAECRQDAESV